MEIISALQWVVVAFVTLFMPGRAAPFLICALSFAIGFAGMAVLTTGTVGIGLSFIALSFFVGIAMALYQVFVIKPFVSMMSK